MPETTVNPPKPHQRKRRPKAESRKTDSTPKTSPKSFEFVFSDLAGKPPPEARRFIRSHVMKGKNTKRRNGNETVEHTPVTTEAPPCSDDISIATQAEALRQACNRESSHREAWTECRLMIPLAVPALSRPPPDLTLFNFADPLNDSSRFLIYKFFTALKDTMYPAEWCFQFDRAKTCWFRWLFVDAAYLNSVLFTVSAFQDLNRQSAVGTLRGNLHKKNVASIFSPETQLYLRRTIRLLQGKLEDRERQLDDTTAAVVVTLAMVAEVVRDTQASEAHVAGLREMVRMRGGLQGFESNRQIQIKICRIDLGWSIKHGRKPDFYDDQILWKPILRDIIANHQLRLDGETHPDVQRVLDALGPKLRSVFVDLRDFATMANSVIPSKRKLLPEHYQEIMLSVQYRLLFLGYSVDENPLEEAIRLALITFQMTIFFQIRGTKFDSNYLATRLRRALERIPASSQAINTTDVRLWALLIGSILIFDGMEPWLVALIAELARGDDWPAVRERMKRVLWIDVVHDEPGKEAFTAAMQEMEATAGDILSLIL